jgi:hypothetical protein
MNQITNFGIEIIERFKRNFLILFLSIIMFIFLIFINITIKLNIANNKTSKRIVELTVELDNLFSNNSLLKNPDYIEALMNTDEDNSDITKTYSGLTLKDFYIASSSNTIVCNKLYDGFINIDMLGVVLDHGARSITLDIFSDSYCSLGKPVVAMNLPTKTYYKNTIGTYNYINFDDCCSKIIQHAFLKNKDDPLFIIFNLHLDSLLIEKKENVINNMVVVINKYFGNSGRLLGSDYSYQRTIIANAPIEDLMGKIVIFCGKGFAGTDLEELVNYSWEEKSEFAKDSMSPQFMLQYSSKDFNELDSGGHELLKQLNQKNLTIIQAYNDLNITSMNYNIKMAWEAGCQFVGIDYSNLISTSLYSEKFGEYNLILKDKSMRFEQEYLSVDTYQNPNFDIKGKPIGNSAFLKDLVL